VITVEPVNISALYINSPSVARRCPEHVDLCGSSVDEDDRLAQVVLDPRDQRRPPRAGGISRKDHAAGVGLARIWLIGHSRLDGDEDRAVPTGSGADGVVRERQALECHLRFGPFVRGVEMVACGESDRSAVRIAPNETEAASTIVDEGGDIARADRRRDAGDWLRCVPDGVVDRGMRDEDAPVLDEGGPQAA
jgi:hypothetical protein